MSGIVRLQNVPRFDIHSLECFGVLHAARFAAIQGDGLFGLLGPVELAGFLGFVPHQSHELAQPFNGLRPDAGHLDECVGFEADRVARPVPWRLKNETNRLTDTEPPRSSLPSIFR